MVGVYVHDKLSDGIGTKIVYIILKSEKQPSSLT